MLAIGLGLGGVAALSASGQPASRQHGPNVVLIVADDLDTALFSRMPYFRRAFVAEGTSFTRAYAADSLCCPSRASILRGQFVHNHRVFSNTAPEGGYAAFVGTGDEESTLATWLDDAGYRTGLFGKYLNGYPPRDEPVVPPGWDDWHAAGESALAQLRYTMVENGRRVRYGDDRRDFNTDVLGRKAREFVRAHEGGSPFFMYVAPFAPHMPATPPARYAHAFAKARAPRTDAFNQRDVSASPEWVRNLPRLTPERIEAIDTMYRKRRASMLAVRDLVRGLVATLRRTGHLENTYLIFTSDNGYHLGQHRAKSGKRSPYEEDIHVPLVVRGPDVPAGRTVRALTSNTDLAPTVSDLARVPHPEFVDGRSLVPFLRGEQPVSWRDAVLSERHALMGPRLAPDYHRTAAEKSHPHNMIVPPPFRAMRTSRYTYVEYVNGEVELYDNRRDPAQLRNLAPVADRALLSRMSARLHRLSTCEGAQCREADTLT